MFKWMTRLMNKRRFMTFSYLFRLYYTFLIRHFSSLKSLTLVLYPFCLEHSSLSSLHTALSIPVNPLWQFQCHPHLSESLLWAYMILNTLRTQTDICILFTIIPKKLYKIQLFLNSNIKFYIFSWILGKLLSISLRPWLLLTTIWIGMWLKEEWLFHFWHLECK